MKTTNKFMIEMIENALIISNSDKSDAYKVGYMKAQLEAVHKYLELIEKNPEYIQKLAAEVL